MSPVAVLTRTFSVYLFKNISVATYLLNKLDIKTSPLVLQIQLLIKVFKKLCKILTYKNHTNINQDARCYNIVHAKALIHAQLILIITTCDKETMKIKKPNSIKSSSSISMLHVFSQLQSTKLLAFFITNQHRPGGGSDEMCLLTFSQIMEVSLSWL